MSHRHALVDAIIRRQVFLERFSNGEIAKTDSILDQIASMTSGFLIRAENVSQEQLDAILRRIDTAIAQSMTELGETIESIVEQIAEAELGFNDSLFRRVMDIVPQLPDFSMLQIAIYQQALTALDPDNVITLSEAIEQFAANKRRDIISRINQGLANGDSISDITRGVNELVSNRHKWQARSLVRTSVNHASSVARRAFNLDNSGIIGAYEWVSTLDSRTTLICAGRDGRRYNLQANIYPPAHWGCRSTTIPILNDELEDGLSGVDTGNLDFDTWLRGQSASFQDEYFSQFTNGKQLARLFRAGKMPTQKFRNELGKQYSLDELRALDPLAFDRANIEAPSGS